MKSDVRRHAILMLGRADNSSPIPDPPGPDVIEEFNIRNTGGPSKLLGELRLDLDGPVRSPWNVKAAKCFRKNFQKSKLYRRWPDDLVEEAFLRHVETIRTNYYRQIGRVLPSATLDRQIRSARRSRLKTVRSGQRRVTVHHSNSSLQLIRNRKYICRVSPSVSGFSTYVNRLADEGGMSGDETDHCGRQPIRGQRKFLVQRLGWRSKEVTTWLRVIDALYMTHRFSLKGRASRGNWVRQRIDSGEVDWSRFPVSGLPENFYDPAWLRGLSQDKRNKLDVQPPVSLEYSAEVLK